MDMFTVSLESRGGDSTEKKENLEFVWLLSCLHLKPRLPQIGQVLLRYKTKHLTFCHQNMIRETAYDDIDLVP